MARSAFVQGLVKAGLVQQSEVDALVAKAGSSDFNIANSLFESLQMQDDRMLLGRLYGDAIGKAHVPLARVFAHADALEKLVPDMARKLGCVPVYFLGGVLTVAMPHPEDPAIVANLSRLVGVPVSALFAFPQEIENAIEIQYRHSQDLERLSDKLAEEVESAEGITPAQLVEFAKSAGVVDLVRGLLLYCVKRNASDLHIQPNAKAIDVRFRVDGQLQTLVRLNKAMGEPVMMRLKVISQLDVTDRRHPQDGRLSLELHKQAYDFRLSTVPTVFGEKAVIRAIGALDKTIKPLEQLGFSKRNLRLLTGLINKTNGVLYVTGPTSSGKTTTLYAALAKVNRPDINIVTVEDPVELRIDGLSQIQTNASIGMDFAKALRAVLRQDPQIVLVGEVRDEETAHIASQAALTGHLVMTTLHTNNSFQAITRLVDMGLDPYLVAPSMIGAVAQRLVRRICAHCKEEYYPSAEVLESLFYNRAATPVRVYRGKGCEACENTGYAGRIGIHEIFVVTDDIRDMIVNRVPLTEIQREALRRGFKSMRYDGVLKALQGITTLEEVDRVTLVANYL